MTGIAVINSAQALEHTFASLGVPSETGTLNLSKGLIAQSLRRAAFNAAPCSAHSLRSLVFTTLAPLSQDAEAFKAAITETLEDLIAMGDILEMQTDIEDGRDLVLRPAPPAFVARQDGTFVLLGIAGDEITPTMRQKVILQENGLRCVRPNDVQGFRAELLDLGLIELSERVWLFAPASQSAAAVVTSWTGKLPIDAKPEEIEDLEILDTALPTSFYKGRWAIIRANHSGLFVGRRHQRFGSRLWCLVDVKDGIVQRLTDIRTKDSRARDCDEAWRLQSAMDAVAGTPQKVLVIKNGATSILAFEGPLPTWAARRLSFIGERVLTPRALLAFRMSNNNVENELQWLDENLWLARVDGGEV
jgi:hypothetical protein